MKPKKRTTIYDIAEKLNRARTLEEFDILIKEFNNIISEAKCNDPEKKNDFEVWFRKGMDE